MPPISFNFPSKNMEHETIANGCSAVPGRRVAVIGDPLEQQVPPFIEGFQPDLIATREMKASWSRSRPTGSSSRAIKLTLLAEIVNAQPGWRLDVVV